MTIVLFPSVTTFTGTLILEQGPVIKGTNSNYLIYKIKNIIFVITIIIHYMQFLINSTSKLRKNGEPQYNIVIYYMCKNS